VPNRTYIDLKNDTTKYEGEWVSIANRYEKIQETLNSPDVDPIIREAIFYSLYNFKSWYSTYAMTFKNMESLSGEYHSSYFLIQSLLDRLEYWSSRTDELLSILKSSSAEWQAPDIWGYEKRFEEWENNLYDQLKLIDGLYGRSISTNQDVYNSIVAIENLNTSIAELNTRFKGLVLPYQLYFAKSTEDIDYSKVVGEIIGIDNNLITTLSDSDFVQSNKLTSLTIPVLQEGQYMLRVRNKNSVSILESSQLENNWYQIAVNRSDNFVGWLIDGKYPIIYSESLGNRQYKVYLGNPNLLIANKQIFENYINPISLILDVKPDEDRMIYDFFYGQYIDEFKEILSNGNHLYLRTIKDRDGTVISVYRIELNFNTKTDQGLPTIYYQKVR